MKTKIKTSIIIVALLFGFISSQYIMVDTKPSTTDTNNPPPTTPRPQPSTNGTIPNSEIRPRPSGSGLRGESGKRPEGPSNIPPKDGGYSDKLAAITDAKILKVKNVLRFLPLVEQDLLAGKFLLKIFFNLYPLFFFN
jgi:hypothetical protein